jgi:PKD repeat protein
MAVSSNAYSYTFPTDTFNGTAMYYLCGLLIPPPFGNQCYKNESFYNFNCQEHVIQYYNENYGVLIGTGDLSPITNSGCFSVEGNNRYERALNFYNFCDSNAVNRGTSLQWQYQEIVGVGHDQHAMYNNKANPNDSSTIAETLLFDSPHHSVPSLSPVASFYADTTLIEVGNAVNFTNTSFNATTYVWDFGDSTTSFQTNPSHIYSTPGTYTIQLTASNSTSCNNWWEKRYYIKVINPLYIPENITSEISVYPNPNSGIFMISSEIKVEQLSMKIFDVLGHEIKNLTISTNEVVNIESLSNGCYFYSLYDVNTYLGHGALLKQ